MEETQRTPDRRSTRSRQAVLAAAWDLFEKHGLGNLTIEAIAATSGVAKTTIYRSWPTKAAILMDALRAHLSPLVPFPDTGSAKEDLIGQLNSVVELFTTTSAGNAFLSLVAASQEDPTLAAALAEGYINVKRAEAIAVLQRGIERGEFPSSLDLEVTVDSLYGAIYYRLLVSHDPPPSDYAERLVDQHQMTRVDGG